MISAIVIGNSKEIFKLLLTFIWEYVCRFVWVHKITNLATKFVTDTIVCPVLLKAVQHFVKLVSPVFGLFLFYNCANVGFYSQQKKKCKKLSVLIWNLNYALALLGSLDVNSTDSGLGSLNGPRAI